MAPTQTKELPRSATPMTATHRPSRQDGPTIKRPGAHAPSPNSKAGYTERLLTKAELRDLLNLPSTRSIDELVRRRVISSVRMGWRTVRFDPVAVRADLDRVTLKAVS